jgi:hypothetical protein
VTDFVCGPPNCVSRSLSIHIVSTHSQTLPASAALSRLEYIARRRFPSRAHHVLPAVAAIVVAGVSLVARTASKNCCCSVIRYACWPSLRRSLAGWAICPGASSAVALLFAARCRRTHPPLCSMCVCVRTFIAPQTLPIPCPHHRSCTLSCSLNTDPRFTYIAHVPLHHDCYCYCYCSSIWSRPNEQVCVSFFKFAHTLLAVCASQPPRVPVLSPKKLPKPQTPQGRD